MKEIYGALPTDLSDIKPDWSWGPIGAAMQVVNWVLAIATLVAIVGAIFALAGWAISRHGGGRHQDAYLKGFGICLAVAVLLGSIVSIMTFAGNFDLGL